jgi:hypothetical protein
MNGMSPDAENDVMKKYLDGTLGSTGSGAATFE